MAAGVVSLMIIVFILWAVFIYNRFVSLANKSKEAWSDITVELKRRYDLIPNIVNTVQGYAAHEKMIFQRVTEARAGIMNVDSISDRGVKESVLSGAVKSVIMVAESYPVLKANQGFLGLQAELSETENRIQMARRYYNGNVRLYNTAVSVFPGNVIAAAFGFHELEFFSLEGGDVGAIGTVEISI